jgi:hypothetical protein
VAQNIAEQLRTLLVMYDTLYPNVMITPLGGLYIVRVRYPTVVEGHRVTSEGVVCEAVVPTPVIVDANSRQDQADLATLELQDHLSEWYALVVESADVDMTDDATESITFAPFRVMQ